jgi:maltose-binding protein MalE
MADTRLDQQAVEALETAAAQVRMAHQAVEVLETAAAQVRMAHQAVEVLWREHATPDVFIWPHNWVAEVRERLEWRTDVMVPRRNA